MPMAKDNCPKCDGLKDARSKMCRTCKMKFNHPRQGTAQDWKLLKTGYLGKFMGGRRCLQHRIIIEEHIGRRLLTSEHVHHKNGNRSDNRIDNLEVMSSSEHHRSHMTSDEARKRGMLGLKARWGYGE